MDVAGNYNLEIVIGDTFTQPITFYQDEDFTNPYDLTGSSFKAQVRKCKDNATVILEFQSPTTIDMTQAATGTITLKATAAATSALTQQNAVYDLVWTDTSSNVTTVMEGAVTIVRRVTQP